MRAAAVGAFCFSVVLLGALPQLAMTAGAETDPECAGRAPGLLRTVNRIIDGETLGLDDHSELRLIGALAPRAMDIGAEFESWTAENRTREALTAFVLGKSIELRFGDERQDRYGRLQAQAFLVEADQRRWVQGYLLQHGLARAYTQAGNRGCANELIAAERGAREARLGLWAEAAYQVRQAGSARELLPYRATFQVVEGQVARVAHVRGVIHLSFGRNWRQAFSVSLPNRGRILLGRFAADPKELEGRHVRVRGWIEGGKGVPIMDLSSAGHVDVMGEAQAESRQDR